MPKVAIKEVILLLIGESSKQPVEFQNIEKLFATEVIKNHKKQSVFSSNLSKIDAIEFVNLEEKTNHKRDAHKWIRRFFSIKRRDNF